MCRELRKSEEHGSGRPIAAEVTASLLAVFLHTFPHAQPRDHVQKYGLATVSSFRVLLTVKCPFLRDVFGVKTTGRTDEFDM
jgi:hypothetical protein